MRRSVWLGIIGLGLFVAIAILAVAYYLRIEPLPTAAQMQEAAERRWAECLREAPSVKNLPPIQPMRVEQALVLEQINGLVPGSRGKSDWRPPNDPGPPEVNFRVEYLAYQAGDRPRVTVHSDQSPDTVGVLPRDHDDLPFVVVDVWQYPNEAWPLYYATWSPVPDILQHGDPELDITRVKKFGNKVVMNRQYRSPDETGHLWFYWPSGKNLVSITYLSKVIDEEVLRRYLERFPSSL